MTEERRQEIIAVLQNIVDSFVPSADEPQLTTFGLISRYNAIGQNIELIGGDWAGENGFNLPV